MEHWRARQIKLLDELLGTGGKVDATASLVPTAFFAAYQGLCDRELMEKRGQVISGRDFTTAASCRREQMGVVEWPLCLPTSEIIRSDA